MENTMTARPPQRLLGEIQAGETSSKVGKNKRDFTKFRKILAGTGVALVLLLAAAAYLIYSSRHETTDDAYTTGEVHDISSRVAGTVIEVTVRDNQRVKKGDILARLDPRDFQVLVDKSRADYSRALADFERVKTLRGTLNGDIAISKQEYDQMTANLGIAKATLDDAINQLSYCEITAPEDGFVGNKTVQTGNRVAVGTVLMSVVQDLWVVANYKETQVGKMVAGQKVTVQLDEFPGHTFTGRIDSFSPGSGSIFALLPPENATGNFTKIVQRVPVKILLDPASVRDYEGRLVPGLSVEADVCLAEPLQTPSVAWERTAAIMP
jgi:membrane fusion protein (multidrug efflux system)